MVIFLRMLLPDLNNNEGQMDGEEHERNLVGGDESYVVVDEECGGAEVE